MLTCSRPLTNLQELRNYVNETLCSHDQLEPETFPVTERILLRGGQPCGLYFCLHGPRSVKFTAIWETDSNTVLFYGPTGERFFKTQLSTALNLQTAVLTEPLA